MLPLGRHRWGQWEELSKSDSGQCWQEGLEGKQTNHKIHGSPTMHRDDVCAMIHVCVCVCVCVCMCAYMCAHMSVWMCGYVSVQAWVWCNVTIMRKRESLPKSRSLLLLWQQEKEQKTQIVWSPESQSQIQCVQHHRLFQSDIGLMLVGSIDTLLGTWIGHLLLRTHTSQRQLEELDLLVCTLCLTEKRLG